MAGASKASLARRDRYQASSSCQVGGTGGCLKPDGAASEDRLDQLDFIQHTYDLQVPTAGDGQAAPEEPRENDDEAS